MLARKLPSNDTRTPAARAAAIASSDSRDASGPIAGMIPDKCS